MKKENYATIIKLLNHEIMSATQHITRCIEQINLYKDYPELQDRYLIAAGESAKKKNELLTALYDFQEIEIYEETDEEVSHDN